MTNAQRLEFRARDAVSRLLLLRLTVPEIYFDAPWPSPTQRSDILAIDRAGSGDVHVVEVKHDIQRALESAASLLSIPAQFRWIAFFADTLDGKTPEALRNSLLPPTGMGRIGAISVVQATSGDLSAKVMTSAERFGGSYRKQVAEFVRRHEADVSAEELAMAEDPSGSQSAADPALIHSRISEVNRLIDTGHPEAGFLLAWLLLETVLHLLAQRAGIRAEGQSPAALIRSLTSYGLLNDDDAKVALKALEVRNSLLHGSGSAKQLPISAVELKEAADRLIARVEAGQHAGTP